MWNTNINNGKWNKIKGLINILIKEWAKWIKIIIFLIKLIRKILNRTLK